MAAEVLEAPAWAAVAVMLAPMAPMVAGVVLVVWEAAREETVGWTAEATVNEGGR